MTARIEAQIERFAPGFRDRILARHTMTPAQIQAYNANYIGGDINGGVQDLGQLFTRPVVRLDPYSTPNQRYSSARRPLRLAAASTGCVATMRRARRYGGFWADERARRAYLSPLLAGDARR